VEAARGSERAWAEAVALAAGDSIIPIGPIEAGGEA